MKLAGSLALTNALLSLGAIAFMAAGYRAIRARQVRRHRTLMVLAVVCSALFMGLFVYRFVTFGFRPLTGPLPWRVVYYIVLFAHEPLAVISVPLVLVALGLGLAGARVHPEIARAALVVWLTSAITGVLLYVLLYLLPVA